MNRKAIRQKLNKKFHEWMESIKDQDLRNMVEKDTIITGGSIASMLMGEPIHDYDLYFRNKRTVKAIAEYYVKQFNEEHKDNKNKPGYRTDAFVLDGAENIKEQAKKATGKYWKTKMFSINEDRIKIIIRSDGVAGELPDPEDIVERADDIPAEEIEEKDKYRPVYLSCNAITLSNHVQLVIRFYGEADQIHDNFDFIHCTNYWTSWDNKLYTNTEALESLLSKNLIYRGSKYPLCSVIRTRKFIKRGWHINAGQYLKMLFQVSELDLKDVQVLEEQLIGVDTAYFMMLIQMLEEQQKRCADKNESLNIDSSYIATLVDKIFG